eukprot:c25298_g1_i1 orf=235-2316(-)
MTINFRSWARLDHLQMGSQYNCPHFQFLLLIPLLIIVCLPCAFSLSFDYTPIGTNVIRLGNVSIQPDSSVELTYDTNGNPQLNAGQVFNQEPLFLWDSSTKEAASFNCSFQFGIKIVSAVRPADGLTFFLLSSKFTLDDLSNAKGGGLGLFNGSRLPASAGVKIVAVEFDTFKNSFDPDDNHIGIDVNTDVSAANSSDLNFSLSSSNSVFSWVDYSSSQTLLEVYATNISSTKPSSPLLSYPINLTEFLPEYVYIGFSAATGSDAEFHQLFSWSFNSTTIGPSPKGPNKRLIVGLAMGIIAGSAIILLIGLQMRRRRRRRFDQPMPQGIDMSGLPSPSAGGYGPRKFDYKDLSGATKNFSEEYLLGQGGFGPVYKGVLPEDRSEVAVKCISQRSSQGEKEFFAEVTIISRIRHRNLVQLKGWCREKAKLLLVYEFLPKGSLDTHLFSESSSSTLDWSTRYKIVCGLGSALQYLHLDCEKVIVHRDIKPSNVMLDANYNAKLGDFGLARQLGEGLEGHTTLAAGTIGYMAPESYGTARATPESDVFSYGIVLLEVACGRRPVDASLPAQFEGRLLNWVWDLHSQGRLRDASDTRLEGAFDEEELHRTLIVGLACSHPDPKSRPSIRLALEALQGRVPLPIIPISKPVAYYGSPISMNLFSTTSGASSSYSGPPISVSSSPPNTDTDERALLHSA